MTLSVLFFDIPQFYKTTEVGQNLEPDELIQLERFTFEELNKMILNSGIQDAKTIAGVTVAMSR